MKLDLSLIDGISSFVEKKHDSSLHKPITIAHGDNMALLRYMKEEMMRNYFHIGIVDPPYGISVGDMKLGANKDSKPRSYEMGKWDNEVPSLEYWFLLSYVCKDLIIWGGNYFTGTNVAIYEIEYKNESKLYTQDITPIIKSNNENIKKINFSKGVVPGRCFYYWDKMNNGMSFADGELALTTLDKSARNILKSRNLMQQDGEKRHPTQKPSYLYDAIHLENNLQGKRVLDTHGGSFSHAIAAFRNKVELLIIDREESYYKSGLEAFEKEFSKARLF